MENNKSVMLIDGMSLLFRGFFATSYRGQFMKTSQGVPTNAIFGFIRYMWDAVEQFQPSHLVCCWDMGSKTFRTDMYPEYKGNRLAPPEELIPQFELIKEVTSSFGITNIGLAGYEADDVIGTLARKFAPDINVKILTGDHDSLQLVDENVHAIIMKKGMSNYAVYTLDLLMEEKGLTPRQFIDLKGLMGDASDNYPGVNGIGEKTAVKLLLKYGSIGNILEHLHELTPAIRSKFESNLDMLHLSRDLAEIRCNVPVSCSLDACHWSLNMEQVTKTFEQLEITKMLKLIHLQTN